MSNNNHDSIVVLVRHPESGANLHLHKHQDEIAQDISDILGKIGDPDISEKGIKQSIRTAEHLMERYQLLDHQPKVVVRCSKFRRTHFIADQFIDQLKKNSVPFDGPYHLHELQEYTRKGKEVGPGFIKDQTAFDFVERVYDSFVNGLLTEHQKEQNDLLNVYFGHSMFWATTLSLLFYRNQEPHLTKEELILKVIDSDGRVETIFETPNCSITTIRWDSKQNKWSILGFGKNDHLGPELITGEHSVF